MLRAAVMCAQCKHEWSEYIALRDSGVQHFIGRILIKLLIFTRQLSFKSKEEHQVYLTERHLQRHEASLSHQLENGFKTFKLLDLGHMREEISRQSII